MENLLRKRIDEMKREREGKDLLEMVLSGKLPKKSISEEIKVLTVHVPKTKLIMGIEEYWKRG
ncbi:hypothetical protein GC093_20565 [Paenibacillus sp. LMG 31456]|uniref:Uncharacterized protein n=1 Tax=Paenibacillus foliorum TaxID=2654974 RepID=A0A972K0G9_9BACL|nr:hypothetical protein [Paenibacillus foliorum]NOU95604.1 hypothetical protein [Paenibacillus foliorum]